MKIVYSFLEEKISNLLRKKITYRNKKLYMNFSLKKVRPEKFNKFGVVRP
jgi:hypothetical protein